MLIQTKCDVILDIFFKILEMHMTSTVSQNFNFLKLESVLRVFDAIGKDDHILCIGSTVFGGSFVLTEFSPLGLGL